MSSFPWFRYTAFPPFAADSFAAGRYSSDRSPSEEEGRRGTGAANAAPAPSRSRRGTLSPFGEGAGVVSAQTRVGPAPSSPHPEGAREEAWLEEVTSAGGGGHGAAAELERGSRPAAKRAL